MPNRDEITSTKNPIVARFQDAARGKSPGEMVVDGNRLLRDALGASLAIRVAAVSPKLLGQKDGHDLRSRLSSNADEFFECSDRVLERMSSLETPQGAIAIARRPTHTLEELVSAPSPLVVVAAGVRDPGNLGAIVRAAEAAGATGCVVLDGSADPFRDKAVRGAAGSSFRLPTVGGVAVGDLITAARESGLQLVVAEGAADHDYVDVDFAKPTALVLGAEGPGIPGALRDAATEHTRIPMNENVESLNVAVAAGVLLFEARRQRR